MIALASSSCVTGQTQEAACNPGTMFDPVSAQLAAHDYELAAHSLDVIRECPGLSDLQSFQLGWLYGRARHFDSALKVFRNVPENVPDRATHDFAVALSEFEMGDYGSTADLLAKLDSAGLSDAKSANLLAVSYSKLGRYREAYAILAVEIRKKPGDLNTHLNLITVCAEGGDFKAAAEAASETVKLFPSSADAYVSRGAAEALLGQVGAAYEDFSHGAGLEPSRPDIRFFVALMDYKSGKFADAIAVLNAAIKSGLEDSDLHYLLAECLLKAENGNIHVALKELNLAVADNADSTSARTLRGRLLLEAGHPDQALSDLEFANKHQPDSRSAAYTLARAYRAVGRNADAQAIFSKLRNQPASTLSEMGDRRLNDALSDERDGSQ